MIQYCKSICLKPHETIFFIIDNYDEKHVLLIAAIIGISNNIAVFYKETNIDLVTCILAVLAGMIKGIVSLYLLSYLIFKIGEKLNSVSTINQIKAAIAWGNVPNIFGLVLFLILILIKHYNSIAMLKVLIPIFGIMKLVLAVWSIILIVIMLRAVQKIALIKTLLSIVLTIIIIVTPVILTINFLRFH